MKDRPQKTGFTLVEVLVATAIIVTIVSMVYGSYFATSKSTQAYNAKMDCLHEARKAIAQMARQIRGSYAGAVDTLPQPAGTMHQKVNAIPENTTNYFEGNQDNPSGEILHLITSNAISPGQNSPQGLFDVIYRLDKRAGTLFLSQTRFVGVSKEAAQRKSWHQLAKGIRSLNLRFFDGRQWQNTWDFKENKKLPCAIRIKIDCEGRNHHQYHYETIAHICCGKNDRSTPSDLLVSISR